MVRLQRSGSRTTATPSGRASGKTSGRTVLYSDPEMEDEWESHEYYSDPEMEDEWGSPDPREAVRQQRVGR